MKSILMKMDKKVAEQLSGINGVCVGDEGACLKDGCGYTIHEVLDENTVMAWIQAEDKVVDAVVAEPVKTLDLALTTDKPIVTIVDKKEVFTARVKPELVTKLAGWPVEVVKEEPAEIVKELPVAEVVK